jgi:hypothetical protein
MTCECGHERSAHGTTGWPRWEPTCDSFTCCDRRVNRTPGRRGSEHDFITHKTTYCQCKEFVQQQQKEVTA